LFKQDPQKIDLVILDVIMPNVGGRAAYEEMQKIRSDLPVILASGYSPEVLKIESLLEKGVRLVSKPFSSIELLTAIRQTLDARKTP